MQTNAEITSDWPVPGHDWQRTRFTPVDIVPPFKTQWQHTLGALISASEVTGDENVIPVTTITGEICALSADGKVKWSWRPKSRKQSSAMPPYILNGKIYVAREGHLRCFSKDGAMLWEKIDTKRADIHKKDWFESDFYSFLRSGGIVGAEASTLYLCSSFATLRQIDANDGSLLWSFWGGKNCPNFECVDMYVFANFDWIKFTGFDLRKKQMFTPEVENFIPTLATGGVAYHAHRDGVVAVDVASGRALWHTTAPGGNLSSDGAILITLRGDKLVALDAKTGEELWHTSEKQGCYRPEYKTVVSPSYVYTYTWNPNPHIQVLDKASGKTVFESPESLVNPCNLTAINGILYLKDDKTVMCFGGAR